MKCNEIHFALPASFQIHTVNSHEALTAGSAVFRDEKRKEKERVCSQELTTFC